MKLNIRLPGDDEFAPNPYDSKTPINQLGPRWLWDWKWWAGLAGLAVVYLIIRWN